MSNGIPHLSGVHVPKEVGKDQTGACQSDCIIIVVRGFWCRFLGASGQGPTTVAEGYPLPAELEAAWVAESGAHRRYCPVLWRLQSKPAGVQC